MRSGREIRRPGDTMSLYGCLRPPRPEKVCGVGTVGAKTFARYQPPPASIALAYKDRRLHGDTRWHRRLRCQHPAMTRIL